MMALPTTLHKLPLKIRRHIYSYSLINHSIIDMIARNVTDPQVKGLFLSCPELYHEASEYYFKVNTFQLSLWDPIYSPHRYPNGHDNLKKRLGRVQNLHVDVRPLHGSQLRHMRLCRLPDRFGTGAVFQFLVDESVHRRRWLRFLKLLAEAHRGRAGPLLRNLVIVDRYTHWLKSSDMHGRRGPSKEVPRDSIPGLSMLAEHLVHKVGTLTIERRSGYTWGTHVPFGELPYEVRETKSVSPRKKLQPGVRMDDDTAKHQNDSWLLDHIFPLFNNC